jgi:hypothetical protein
MYVCMYACVCMLYVHGMLMYTRVHTYTYLPMLIHTNEHTEAHVSP